MSDEKRIWTVLEVLNWTRRHFEQKGFKSPRLDAEVILAHALGMERVMLYARFDQPLKESERAQVRDDVRRRDQAEPVAYIVGKREFWSMDFEVNPSVLIPRPETELAVEIGREILKNARSPSVRLLDLGTGSGCIALALTKECPPIETWAIDISKDACAVAERNTARHQLGHRVHVVCSDLFEALEADITFDLITANLPYVPAADYTQLSPEIRDHEPELALVGGENGLDVIRRMIQGMAAHLKPEGRVLIEAGPEQLKQVETILTQEGFSATEPHLDPEGTLRLVEGRRNH